MIYTNSVTMGPKHSRAKKKDMLCSLKTSTPINKNVIKLPFNCHKKLLNAYI